MPTTRKLSQDETDYLDQQGIDTSTLPQQVEVLSPEEAQQVQQRFNTAQAGAIKGGVIPTLKSHAGSLIGGGLAGTAGWGGAALLAPESGGASFLIPAIASLVASTAGSKIGDLAQKKVVEPAIGMSPQQQQEEEQSAQMAREVYPKTSIATDVVGGILAGGGKPSITAPINAAKGLAEGIANEGFVLKALSGSTSPVYKQAVQNVVTAGALNTAINTGVQLATTGTVDPTELAASSIGGALFSEPSFIGRRLNPQWKPMGKAQTERPSIEETIAPDGSTIPDVEAYRKQGQNAVDAINQQNQQFREQRDAINRLQEESYQKAVDETTRRNKVSADWQTQNWQSKFDDGSYMIGDDNVKREYVRSNKIKPTSDDRPEQQALIKQHNENIGNVPTEQMRQQLFERDYPLRDPEGWQQYQQQKQQEAATSIQRQSDIQESMRAQKAQAEQRQMEAQQRVEDFPAATQEKQQQQIQEATAQRQPAPQGNPLTENQGRIINTKSIAQGMMGHGLAEPREGGQLFQEGERQPGETAPQPQDQLLNREAGKAATIVGNIEGEAVGPEGQTFKGVSYDPTDIGRRLIGIARNNATSDTGYHELVHAMLRDLDRSGSPHDVAIAAEIRKAYGGEEPAATAIGKDYQRTVEDQAGASLPKKIAKYFNDAWAATKIAYGTGTDEDRGQNLVRRMRQRHGEQDTTIAGQEGKGGGAKFQQEPNDLEQYNQLMEEMKGHIKNKEYDKVFPLQQRTEALKNRNPLKPGMPPTEESVRAQLGHGHEEATTLPPLSEVEPSTGPKFQFDDIRFKPTQAAIERIKSDVNDENGERVSSGLFKTYQERQHLLGKWWNPIAAKAKGMEQPSVGRVRDVLNREVNDRTSYRNTLRTQEERALYDEIRKQLSDSADYRIAINEPVYRNGKPTPPQKNPFYYPTTTEPKVADTFRQNQDQPAIQRLGNDFIAQQLRHGMTQTQAEANLKDMVDKFQGSATSNQSNNELFYNAARKEAGIPLPDSWQRSDLLRNLEAYHRRLATDVSYYHNVETNHKTMAALGYKKDPWDQPINEPTIRNISGTTPVRAVMGQLKGENLDVGGRTEHAAETLATTTMLGPMTEAHKIGSSIAQSSFAYSDNPADTFHIVNHAIRNIGDAWTKVYETGAVQMDSKKASDFLNTHLTMAERLQGLSKGLRKIYTLNGLTEHFTKSYLQAAGEYIVPMKAERAAAGDKGAQRFLQSVDPDYSVGKTYSGDELVKTAAEFANQVHGTKDARVLPSWMLHDNEVSAFFKLSNWNIQQTNNFMRNVVNPAVKEGNWTPLIMTTLGTVLGGAVIKQAREALSSKKSAIPSLSEISNSEPGFSGNKMATAYNLMALSSFAGFAGILSQVAKTPFDIYFKNTPQGASFPADEIISSMAGTIRHVGEAITNDPDVDYVSLGTHALLDLVKNNIQLARIAINHAADLGVIKSQSYQKGLSDRLSELRRYKMVSGLPFESQGEAEGNPYLNLKQKMFKREDDIHSAIQEVQPIIKNIIAHYGNNPEVMFEKFRALKQNQYATLPDIEDTPMAFFRYVRFLRNSQGPEAAQEHVNDYMKHRMLNEVKSSMVP